MFHCLSFLSFVIITIVIVTIIAIVIVAIVIVIIAIVAQSRGLTVVGPHQSDPVRRVSAPQHSFLQHTLTASAEHQNLSSTPLQQ